MLQEGHFPDVVQVVQEFFRNESFMQQVVDDFRPFCNKQSCFLSAFYGLERVDEFRFII